MRVTQCQQGEEGRRKCPPMRPGCLSFRKQRLRPPSPLVAQQLWMYLQHRKATVKKAKVQVKEASATIFGASSQAWRDQPALG